MYKTNSKQMLPESLRSRDKLRPVYPLSKTANFCKLLPWASLSKMTLPQASKARFSTILPLLSEMAMILPK